MTHLQIIPDNRIDNKSVTDILQTIASMYLSPLDRWNGKGLNRSDRAAWEIVTDSKNTDFYLTVPSHWQSIMQKQIAVVWPRATVKATQEPLTIQPTSIAKLELKNHFMFSIKSDMRTLGILPSLLEVKRMLGDNEKIAVQILLDPAPPDWWQGASYAYENFLSGKMPTRIQLSIKALGTAGAKALTWATMETISVVTELMTGDPQKPVDISGIDKAAALREKPIGHNVADKLKSDALDVTIRIAVQADNNITAESLMRSVWYSFRTLDGDNSFKLVPVNFNRTWAKMIKREYASLKVNSDYLSLKECSMLMQLPTKSLQQEYKISSVQHRETDLPAIITGGGLHFGEIMNHGKKYPVYLPITDHDELCLPRIVIGGMGCGKTKGFGANLAVQAVKNNMSAIIIDPAKGELGDEIESALPPNQVIRIRFGVKPIAIDWREVKHGERTRNRLANEIISFVEAAADEAGAQTIKFLRAAAKAVPNGRLSEVVSILTDVNYRKKLLLTMRDQEKETWKLFDKMTENRQMQIALPVLNRLDVITGDDYLNECLTSQNGIDFVELLDGPPKAIIIDLPKSELGLEGVDVLASLIATKIDLAMVLRKTTHPVHIIQDEPHQYMRSARTWRSVAVESRKWRFAYCWMFHSWEQIPRGVAEIIKSAGPHYHLYSSSKKTYQDLAEEVKPFELEEAMRTPRHWAINIIRTGGVTITPFLARMALPPSMKNKEHSFKQMTI